MGNATPQPSKIARNHPEQWAPPLLQALILGKPLTPDQQTWAGWAKSDFNPWAYLRPGVSSNWQHMIGAALLWLDPQAPVPDEGPFPATTVTTWWKGLLQAQLGDAKTDTVFRYLGLTEPLSEIYEPFRWGSILGVRLYAWRSPDKLDGLAPALLDLTARYSAAVSSLLALGGVPWTDPAYKGAKTKGFWYDGPTFSTVSERSEAPGFQNDRGPLFCMATDWPLKISKREDWPAQIGRQVLAEVKGGLGMGPAFAAAADLVRGGAVAPVVANLEGIRLFAPQNWLAWPEGLLCYKNDRRNFNTPCIFWTWSDTGAQQLAIGWPWGEGRQRGNKSQGQCVLDGGEVVATVPDNPAASQAVPTTPPKFQVIADEEGVRLVQS